MKLKFRVLCGNSHAGKPKGNVDRKTAALDQTSGQRNQQLNGFQSGRLSNPRADVGTLLAERRMGYRRPEAALISVWAELKHSVVDKAII